MSKQLYYYHFKKMAIAYYGDSFHVIGLRSFADDSLVTPLGPATGESSRTTSLSLLGEELTEIISRSGQPVFSVSSISEQQKN